MPTPDGAFTVFMSINIGSLLSLSLAPVTDKFGYAVTYNPVRRRLIVALLVYFACRGMVERYRFNPGSSAPLVS